jgi:hypothetical protein
MGLTATAKGLTDETGFDCGYITFGVYRQKVAYAYNEEIGRLYEKPYKDFFFKESERLEG